MTEPAIVSHVDSSASNSSVETKTEEQHQANRSAWGETNPGGVDVNRGHQDYDELRRQVTKHSMASGGHDEEKAFDLEDFLRSGQVKQHEIGRKPKKIGVVFKDLSVRGVDPGNSTIKTFPKAVWRTISGQELLGFANFFTGGKLLKPPTRYILQDFNGFVRPGEMLLVLGRPGSGCSTMLRALANQRGGFAAVEGEVSYGGIDAVEVGKKYRGEVNYVPSDDNHFPNLTVEQTLKFALDNKTQKRFKGEIELYLSAFVRMFGIEHTRRTLVGDAYTRGVSGGERKRVSIAEVLASGSSVVCWDNSTRGLDAATAADYARSLRIMTDISNRATITTLYQAGQTIYDQMDKVCLIDAGRMLYFGRAEDAVAYFTDLGYSKVKSQTSSDFLTAITDPIERRFQKGKEQSAPKGAEELSKVFKESAQYAKLLDEISAYEEELKQSDYQEAEDFRTATKQQKSKYVRKKSQYTVSYPRQIWNCAKRNVWLIKGDPVSFYTKIFISVSNAFIVGSLFYGLSDDSDSAFSKGGVLFISILFNGWLQLAELGSAVGGRMMVARHKEFAFYRPSAVSIARVVTDFPLLAIQTIPFSIVIYFLGSLQRSASQFFIFLLFVYLSTFNLTALYRMFASISPSFDEAIRYSGLVLNIFVVYAGYVLSKSQMLSSVPWFGWIQFINPVQFAFEAVMSNEFAGQAITCSATSIVPNGPGYNNAAYQSCTLPGSVPGSLTVAGSDYIQTSYGYSRSNLWRNFGIVIAYTVLYIVIAALASERFLFVPAGASLLQFKKITKATEKALSSEEQEAKSSDDSEALKGLIKSESVFTFKDLCYSVDYEGSKKQLLDHVYGYSKPGEITALMGSSGAGKTTLLNTLSQRNNSIGYVSGDMLVDGKKLGAAFARGTGFVEQQDLHDETATVKEAFEFSAILRQSSEVPKAEKLEYVEKVLELLELTHLQDCIISTLDVEQKKRLTIGVELCAKPKLLLFLDEPTSGLDSTSAFNIVRFLRRLASAGQAIICTIHQPSAELMLEFDRVLALNPGGKTFYFGEIGENGKTMVDYFEARGAKCDPATNPAEFLLEVGTGSGSGSVNGSKVDWPAVWRDSDEAQAVKAHIEKIESERSGATNHDENAVEEEFAASIMLQTRMLTMRVWRNYWRDASYGYSKMYAWLLNGIFNGFTFWMLGDSIANMQNRMFSVFLVILISAISINGTVPKFFMNRMIWEARELPSRIYGWQAFATAQILCEIPYAILASVVYFLVWYFPVGFPVRASISGYVYLMWLLFNLFVSSWGSWIAAFAPSYTVIANVIPFFLVSVQLFTGVIRPYASTPSFWKYWLYYLSPVQWFINGVVGVLLHEVPIRCAQAELAIFNPPPGQTCAVYAQSFLNSAVGYLDNPDATTNCGYCQFSVGDDYAATINIFYSTRWRSFGIFLMFCVTNYMLVYFFVYSRTRGWTFGFSYLIKALKWVFRT